MGRLKNLSAMVLLPAFAVLNTAGCGSGGAAKRFEFVTRVLVPSKSSFARGELVQGVLTVRNTGMTRIDFVLDSLSVGRRITRNNAVVFEARWGNAGINGYLTLDPGASGDLAFQWNQLDSSFTQVPAGRYTILAWLNAVSVNGASVNLQTGEAERELAAPPVEITIQ